MAEKDAKLPEKERRAAAEAYAKESVELLRQAIKNGHKDAAAIKKDPNLDPLRSRPEFQKLLSELEAKPP